MKRGLLVHRQMSWQSLSEGEKKQQLLLLILCMSWEETHSQMEGEYSVILNSREEAVCIIRTTKVYVVPFCEITETHAFKEGEGDKSLSYWRKVHEEFFKNALERKGLNFDEQMKVVCEEFEVLYA